FPGQAGAFVLETYVERLRWTGWAPDHPPDGRLGRGPPHLSGPPRTIRMHCRARGAEPRRRPPARWLRRGVREAATGEASRPTASTSRASPIVGSWPPPPPGSGPTARCRGPLVHRTRAGGVRRRDRRPPWRAPC